MSTMFTEGQMFQHKDGGIYKFVQVVRYSDRVSEDGVLYEHVWPFEKGMWVRPVGEWADDRFVPIGPGAATEFIDSMSRSEAQEYVKANKQRRKEHEAS